MPTAVGHHKSHKRREVLAHLTEVQRAFQTTRRDAHPNIIDPQNSNRVLVMMDVPDMAA